MVFSTEKNGTLKSTGKKTPHRLKDEAGGVSVPHPDAP